jgi:ATP-dependent RNA helicase DDX55/SPB4
VSFLNAEGRSCKVIVYFLTCASVEFYSLVLQRMPQLKGLQVAALHGKLKQVSSLHLCHRKAVKIVLVNNCTLSPAGTLECVNHSMLLPSS